MAAKKIAKKTAKKAAKRAPNSHLPHMMAKEKPLIKPELMKSRDDYVRGLLLGMSRTEAAIHAGFAESDASARGRLLWGEEYVQQQFKKLREAAEEEELITRKELLLNLKSIACDDTQFGRDRIMATVALAKMLGYDTPPRGQIDTDSGVMVIPMPVSQDEEGTEDPVEAWEKQAKMKQKLLKAAVRD